MTSPAPAATILIVDDEIQNCKVLEALLRPEGYSTLTAASGEEALALVAQHAVDLILLDVMMPGMDGYQVASALKANPATSNIPIIIVTASIDRSTRLAGLAAGAEEFLIKPVERAELWLRVRNLLRLKTLSDLLQNHGMVLEREVQARTADLSASELRFRQIAENIREVFWLTDPEKKQIFYCSPAYETIWGRSCEDYYASPGDWADAIHPDDRERVLHAVQTKLASGRYFEEYRIVRPDGTIRWIRDRAFPVLNEERNVYRIAGLAEDITESRKAAEKLSESERRFSHLLGNIEMVSIMLDTNARITYCNDYLLRLTGWRRAEVIDRDWFELFVPPGPIDPKNAFAALLANQPEAWHLESEILTRSGERRLIRWNNSVLHSGSGEVSGTASIGEDITEQKRAEIRIKYLNRVYAVLSGINTLIVHVSDREKLYREACRIAVEAGGFRMSLIAIVDPGGEKIVPVASAGKDAGLLDSIKGILSSSEDAPSTMVAQAIREKNPVVSNDSQNDPRVVFGKKYAESGVRSMAILPLIVSGDAVGVLSLYASEIDFFHEEELKLLRELAGDIAFALEHIDKVEKLARLSRIQAVMGGINALIIRVRHRKELFDEACRIAVEHGGFGMVWIGLLDSKTLDVTPAAWAGFEAGDEWTTLKSTARDTPEGRGSIGQAVRSKQPIVVNDLIIDSAVGGARRRQAVERGFRSSAALPLIMNGGVVATFVLFAKEANFFSEEEVKILVSLAGDMSFALEHICNEERIARLSRIQAVMSGISSLIVRVRDRQELFDGACRIAIDHGKFGSAWIGTLDPVTQDVTPVAWAGGGSEELLKIKSSAREDSPRGKGAVGRAIREQRPVFNNNIAASTFGGPRLEEIRRLGFQSQITLPLYENQAVVATLTMYTKELNFFDEQEVRLLTELAGDISFALEHIGKEEKIARLSRIQAVMSGINSLIVRVRDRQELFDETCRIAVEHGKFGTAWIGVFDPSTLVVLPVALSGQQVHPARAYLPDVPKGHGIVAIAIREKRIVFDNDIAAPTSVGGDRRVLAIQAGFRSLVAMPFLVEGAVVGHLSLYTKEPNFFNEDELKLLTDLGANISFALENISKQQKFDKLARIRAVSSEINATIIRIHDREALLRETCRIAVEHGKFGLVWIGTVDTVKQEILPVAWHGFPPEIAQRVSWKSSSTAGGTLGEAIHTAKPTVRHDIETEMSAGGMRAEAMRQGCLSTVCLPLVVDNKVVVLISLFAQGKGFFDDEELTLLNEVAADVSFALQDIEKQKKLEYLSHYDALTGLPNRALFYEALKKTLTHASERGWLVAVLFIDLDYFKNVNDTLGHAIGDDLLCQFGNRLLQCVRIRDTVGRLGGDEFALILLMENDQHGAAIVANKVRDALREPFDLRGHKVTVTASIGITLHPADASDPDILIKYADTAMYRAKQAGRDTFRFFTAQMNTEVVARLDLETALRKAVENGEFVLHYQPKVQLNSGRIAGVEALLRWQRPGHGLVPPNEFIPVLEETGLIVRVGSWVIATACRQVGLWMRSPIGPVQVSVNVSGRQFIEGDLEGDVVKALTDNGIAADLLELEMTESSLMANTERTIASLQNLKKLGVQISIDDFGTGYSSLAYLSRFPIDTLKIDIAFVRDVTSNPDHAAIVLAIVRMAHGMKLDVIAEGVETAAQLEYLRRHRCDLIQGYFFSRPLPLPELEQLLREGKCLPASEAEPGKPLQTLLLVDDEPRVLDVLQRLLHQDGYHILSAQSAAEGFELLALHPVQVILCDQRMPGMSGTDFLGRVRDLYPDTFRIVLSAHAGPETIMDAINRGAIHRFYTKPWDSKVLRENIREAFRNYWLLRDAPLKRQGTDPDNTLPPRSSVVTSAQQKTIPAPLPVHGET